MSSADIAQRDVVCTDGDVVEVNLGRSAHRARDACAEHMAGEQPAVAPGLSHQREQPSAARGRRR